MLLYKKSSSEQTIPPPPPPPFMNKAIMTRPRLKNKFLKNTTEENKINYNKPRNYCVNLKVKIKKNYYANLDINNITDNKIKYEDEVYITLDKEVIKGNQTVKLLGIKIDNKLDFNEHISNIYKKASLKLHALARIARDMNKEKLRI